MSTSVSAQGLGSKAWYLIGEVGPTAIQPWNTSRPFSPVVVAGSSLLDVDIFSSSIDYRGVSDVEEIKPSKYIYKRCSTEICQEVYLDFDVVEYAWTRQMALPLDSGNHPLFIVGSMLQRQMEMINVVK